MAYVNIHGGNGYCGCPPPVDFGGGGSGKDGKSAYEIWIEQGGVGTEQDFLASLRGPAGEKGEIGERGAQGPIGPQGAIGPKGEAGPQGVPGIPGVPGAKGAPGEKGDSGKSAYQEWLDAGNAGSASDFIASLKGAKGDIGERGPKGDRGSDGSAGAPGTAGENGADGAPGKSAYQTWLDLGNQGSEQDFINSLKASGSVEADEENITVSDGKVSLKDKAYVPSDHSGLGRVYLRKSISGGKNVLSQDMVNLMDTRFIVQYDFDLNGKTLTFPQGAVLVFEGGSFKNGAIKGTQLEIVTESACFDKTVTVLPGSLKNNVLELRWFKMEQWTIAQYTANHKNSTNPGVSDTNRVIVNKHLRHRLIIPSGVFPFDGHIELVKTYSEYGETYDSGCSLNIQGVPYNEYGDRFLRSAFVFPQSKGFYWYGGLGNGINRVKDMYFESRGHIFELWGRFNALTMPNDRTPNGWTNNDFFNIEMVSWEGSGFYSPANYATYCFHNRYENIRGWFPAEGRAFWEGMCSMSNVYENVTLLYQGIDLLSFEGKNYSVFRNQSAYLRQGNFDRTKYVFHYAGGGIPDFQKRYEDQAAYFIASYCNFESIEEAVVYTEGPYVSMTISITDTYVTHYPTAATKPQFNVSRLNHVTFRPLSFIGIPEHLVLKINSNFGGTNVVESDVPLRVEGLSDQPVYVVPRVASGRGASGTDCDLSYLYRYGRISPQYVKVLNAETMKPGLQLMGDPQIVDDHTNLAQGWLRSNHLIFRKKTDYAFVYVIDEGSIFTFGNYTGLFLRIVNDGDGLLKLSTSRGMVVLAKGQELSGHWHYDRLVIPCQSNMKLLVTDENYPVVFDGDTVLSADGTQLYIITERGCGVFVKGSRTIEVLREANLGSHYQKHLGYHTQTNGVLTTACDEMGNVFWTVQEGDGRTAKSMPAMNTSKIGDETTDGTVRWRYMGKSPQFKTINMQ